MSEEKEDIQITCADSGCGPFTFTPGEQKFYEDRGFTPPKRCKLHREEAKRRRESGNSGAAPTNGYQMNHSDRHLLD